MYSITYTATYSLLLVGYPGVGKTSLLNRFYSDTFNELELATVGIDLVRFI